MKAALWVLASITIIGGVVVLGILAYTYILMSAFP